MDLCIESSLQQRIVTYYSEAGADYRYWSRKRNMHFGFASLQTFFSRERMLDRMSDEVFARLKLDQNTAMIADFGCGVGATLQRAVLRYPALSAIGVTIVPDQKEQCDATSYNLGISERLAVKVEDFHRTSLSSSSCDGVLMMESACYSPEHLHRTLFTEIYRVLKPGGRVTIGDGFLKMPLDQLSPTATRQYQGICRNWSLAGMMSVDETIELLKQAGFKTVLAEDISWKVAPSVAHVPLVILQFLLRQRLTRKRLSKQSIQNVKGSFQALLLGLQRRYFSYYLISATK